MTSGGEVYENHILLEGKFKEDFLRVGFLYNLLYNISKKSFPNLKTCLEKFNEGMYFPQIVPDNCYLIETQKMTKNSQKFKKILIKEQIYRSTPPTDFFIKNTPLFQKSVTLYDRISALLKTASKYHSDEISNQCTVVITKKNIDKMGGRVKLYGHIGHNDHLKFFMDDDLTNRIKKLLNSKYDLLFARTKPLIEEYADNMTKFKENISHYLKNDMTPFAKNCLEEHQEVINSLFDAKLNKKANIKR